MYRQRDRERRTERQGGPEAAWRAAWRSGLTSGPGSGLAPAARLVVGRAADKVSERLGGAAWTAASPRGGARRVRDARLLRTVEPDVVTLQDLFNSAVHEWTAEVDRQRETERQRVTETEVDEAVFLLGWGRG
jgi:hypothetical protein